ncbi:site-specific integrase [Pelagibius sp. 7325]|uniref:site-specific integrase n=1 Tax=Pelagibius sp. 7325 TaxID=3131994 RepID=UPI0030EFA1EC
MSNQNPHLRRRGAVYHYRRRLPAALKEILNRTYFDGSLATADPVVARKLARRISVALDQLSEQLQGMPKALQPTPGQLNLVLKELFDSILREGDRQRDLLAGDLNYLPNGSREEILDGTADPETMERYRSYQARGIFSEGLPEELAQEWSDLATINELACINPLLETALKACDLEIDLAAPSSQPLRQDALSVVAEAYRVEVDRWDGTRGQGQRAPDWIDDKYPLAPAVLQTWSGRLNAEEVNFLARPVEDVAKEYMDRNLQHTRARKTERDWEMAIRYFVSLGGKERIGDITETDVDRFREELLKMPSEFGKGVYAGLEPKQAIERCDQLRRRISEADKAGQDTVRFEGYEWSIEQAKRKIRTMTRKTANKHLSFFTKMWTSRVVPRSLRPMSPFAGALYPKSEVRNDKVRAGRVEYTQDELKRLFTSPVWGGCRSISRRSVAGDLIIPDARFWAPLIAVFTGMRREEICQLKATDFNEHGGIWFLMVQATEGRRLKTPAAQRDIPIHDELVRIGLREYVDFRYPGWLFPELRPSEIDRALGDGLGKWFHRYRRAIGLTRSETDFHSFRTTFTQHLRRAGVPLDHIKPITGHQENDVTLRHYAPVFGLDQKKVVVEKFELGVTLPTIYGRMQEMLQNLKQLEASPLPQARRLRKLVPESHQRV